MAKPKKKTKAQKVEAKLAHDYGYTLAFLKADKDLYHLFRVALRDKQTPEKFQSSVKNSSWYKTHGETFRTNLALKTTDPATYNERLRGNVATISDKAGQMGVYLTAAQTKELAEHQMSLGYSDAQVNDILSGYMRTWHIRGQAQSNLMEMKQSAWRNGVRIPDASYKTWLRSVANGNHTVEDFHEYVRKTAKSLAPGFADQFDAGMDLHDIAAPYMQSMAQILEIPTTDIDLFDPTIRKAMSGVTQDGKPATKSLWQFEQDLRNDNRWLKTNNAQDEVMGAANKVLQDFGFKGA